MQTASKYTVTRFAPATPIPLYLLQRFKALRLEALLLAPTSFVSNHRHEQTFTDSEWAKIITDPSRHHLICTRLGYGKAGGNETQPVNPNSDQGEWVGIVTLRGPLTIEHYNFQGRKGPSLGNGAEETLWNLMGLYIKPKDRCTEVAIAVHEAVLDHLRTCTDELLETVLDARTGLEKPKRARVAGAKPSQNEMLKELYTSLGGYEIGWIGRAVALEIAGNAEPIKQCEDEGDMGPVLIMEKVVEC